MADDTSSPGRPSKVARLVDEHDLGDLAESMERRWTADESQRASLRELADDFNEKLLEAVLREAGVQPLDGELENTYRLLTGDDIGSAERTRAERRLEREGIDVETLTEEFVSYQAIRTFLKNEREASYERTETDRISNVKTTIDQLRGRLRAVTESRLEQLVADGNLDIGSWTVVVDVRIRCDDCGQQYAVSELLDNESCACRT